LAFSLLALGTKPLLAQQGRADNVIRGDDRRYGGPGLQRSLDDRRAAPARVRSL